MTDFNTIDSLASNRTEVRFAGTSEPQLELPAAINEVCYDNNVTTSVYFGIPDTPNAVPERASLRVRFRSSGLIDPQANVYVPNPTQPSTIELKLRAQNSNANAERIHKYRIGCLALGEAVQLLGTPKGYEALEAYEGGSHFPAFMHLLFKGQSIVPLMMIQGRRRHFVSLDPDMPARLTHDSGTSYWMVGDEGTEHNVVYAARVGASSHSIVEIKRPIVDANVDHTLLTRVFGRDYDYELAGRMKRNQGASLAKSVGFKRPTFNNDGVLRSAEHPEVMESFMEREFKLDVNEDPREMLTEITTVPGLYLGESVPSEVYFRFASVGDKGFVEKARDPDFKRSVFQCKTDVADQNGVLTRTELAAFSKEEILRKMGLPNQNVQEVTSPAGLRSRISRYAICEETGNFFTVLADHCTTEDGRPPLNQVEIEYQGRLGFSAAEGDGLDEAAIANDFERICTLVRNGIQKNSKDILPTQTTKQAWLTE